MTLVMRTTCPFCGFHHNRLSVAFSDDDEATPTDGDATMCFGCGAFVILDSTRDAGLRRPTKAERREIERDERFTQLRTGWNEFQRKRSTS
jgi:hypothetical protein